MNTPLKATSAPAAEAVRRFVESRVLPLAVQMDQEQEIPRVLFTEMAAEGLTGLAIPVKYGGTAVDYATLGAIHEELGRGLASVQNACTVFGMVCKPLSRFGSEAQKDKWLPAIAAGEVIPAIAITEPGVGSDISKLETEAVQEDGQIILNGSKKYITLGQIADLFLVFARLNGRGVAVLVERGTPGLRINPLRGLMGLRANMLAELTFENCSVPVENLVGKIGFGFTHVVNYALDEGRYTTACGSVGLAQACLEHSFHYTGERFQFGEPLRKHQLVQKMLSEMITETKAARELCAAAGRLREQGDPAAITETLVAKYHASKTAVHAADHALQLHGASGCMNGNPVERFYRDAKIMEIIEGTSQMHELQIARTFRL
ncbi:acyl-CoA dehydrogenase family protein [Paenibacillus albidus]|uniref:acyl-CoA dehydrogenase family protein n=1 Tax=Paenibacillus albidus TaxID=2041023 RepID=UPI001BE4E228|nr:acyl-CoA dehydrogenase family protein [Paenibacillus albidus]MBT2291736.1 acyl-CoA dehydrogenase family protein [Paenibacillus albidus]